MAKIKKLSKTESDANKLYNKAINNPVNEKSFLLEAGQGKNVNGNVFSLLRSIRSDERFDDYTVRLALVPDKKAEAEMKFEKYGIDNVELLDFDNDEYRVALAASKYLITDNSFPAYFYKRAEQVYLNTWHGTPLKTLGRTDLKNAVSIGNVQANMAKADYLLHPNTFTKEIMMRDFMMDSAYKHKTVVIDYPRNDALYREEFREELTARYELDGKRAIAYMPTWRGTGRDADTEEQLHQTETAIEDILKSMTDDDVLFINLHFLIGNKIDLSKYENVYLFPAEYETYDFLAICDMLITDYSSVSVDFANTGKDIVLYIYDYEQYKKDKGFYLDVEDLPFKKAHNAEELKAALNSGAKEYVLSDNLSCSVRGDSSARMIDLVCRGNEEGLAIEDYGSRKSDLHIAYFENINREDSRQMIKDLHTEADGRVIMFPSNMDENTIETLKDYAGDLDFLRISGRMYCSNEEFRTLKLFKKYGIFKERARKIYQREYMRQIGQFKFKDITVMQCSNKDRINIIKGI